MDLFTGKPVSFVSRVSRSAMFGGPRQGAASPKNSGTGPQTHSSKRQPRESNGEGQCRPGNTLLLPPPAERATHCARLPCSCTRRWRCCAPCAACTWTSCAGSVSAIRSRFTLCSLHSTRSCSPPRLTCCPGTLADACEPRHAQAVTCTRRTREFQLTMSSRHRLFL